MRPALDHGLTVIAKHVGPASGPYLFYAARTNLPPDTPQSVFLLEHLQTYCWAAGDVLRPLHAGDLAQSGGSTVLDLDAMTADVVRDNLAAGGDTGPQPEAPPVSQHAPLLLPLHSRRR